jgi:hypothetical protein
LSAVVEIFTDNIIEEVCVPTRHFPWRVGITQARGYYTTSIEFTSENKEMSLPEGACLTTRFFIGAVREGKGLLPYLGTVVMQWMLLAMYVRD